MNNKITSLTVALCCFLAGVNMQAAVADQNLDHQRVSANHTSSAANSVALSSTDSAGDKYVGSAQCVSCHAGQYEQWQSSDHAKAMQVATAQTVLGDFSGVSKTFHGVENVLYKKSDKFFIDIDDPKAGKETFEITQTFGFYPLQQYLVETEKGRLQALNVAWDSRQKEEGGQRWFHLRAEEEITPDHTFYWKKHFQNWNSRCADCHSTNVQRNYDVPSNSYNTTFSEINVACEACHGPAGKHLALAEQDLLTGLNTGFSRQPSEPLSWQFKEGNAIAQASGEKSADHLNTCGSCHSLRTQLQAESVNMDFYDSSHLQLVQSGPYFADGQLQDETFVIGSFLQSKMHAKGVTCSNCHEPHSGKVLADDNSLCSQCHQPAVYDSTTHHHHQQDSDGAACVNCHMPERTYMTVDDRRDHSFTIPDAELSIKLGVPNACVGCHAKSGKEVDKDNKWAQQALQKWGITGANDHWAHLNHRVYSGDLLVTRPLTDAVNKGDYPDLIRASLLQQLDTMPSRVSTETAVKNLSDSSPLVRRAAVAALANLPAQQRWQILSRYLEDTSRTVRFQLAAALADVLNELPVEQRGMLQGVVEEYRESLLVSADSPATQLSLANLELSLGNVSGAEAHYQQALIIEPTFVPALLNFADYYRRLKREEETFKLLKKALHVAPDSAAVQYSYGLMLVRQGDYPGSLPYLKKSIEQQDATPRFAYVYAIALENQGQLEQAIDVLEAANKRWGNQYELLMTLVQYLEKSGRVKQAYRHISNLSALAPNAPAVKALIAKYRQ